MSPRIIIVLSFFGILLRVIEELNPEIVILDVNMPVLDGVETARRIYQEFPKVKMIFLTLEKDKQLLNVIKSFRIKGYLLKDSAVLEIVNCIKQVASGRSYVSSEISELLMSSLEEESIETDKILLLARLTPTETKFLRLMADSKTNREIAEWLFIGVRTAENHRANMCNKLNLTSNHSLLKFALENKDLILKKALND